MAYNVKSDLTVTGNTILQKDLSILGNAVIEKNLTVKGKVDFADATFVKLSVTGNSLFNTASFNGDASFNGNLIGSQTSNLSINSIASTSINNSAMVTTKDLTVGNMLTGANAHLTGDLSVRNVSGVIGAFSNKIDTPVLNSTDINSTGTATLNNLVVNGSISGNFQFDSGNFSNINVTGLATLNRVTINGNSILNANLTGLTSTATFHELVMYGDGALIQYQFNDPSRPTDIKTSIYPYQVNTSTLTSNKITSGHAVFGDVTFSDFGITGKGKSTFDFINVTGNAQTPADVDQLVVAGNVKLNKTTTIKDLVVTGTTTGIHADVNGIAISPSSVNTGSLTVTGNVNANAGTVTIKDLVVTGTATGVSAEVNGADISPKSVHISDVTGGLTLDTNVPARLWNVTANDITAKTVTSTALNVSGKTVVKDIEVTGTVTGFSVPANVDGLDIRPATITTTGNGSIGGTFGVTGKTTLGELSTSGKATVSSLDVTGASTFTSLNAASTRTNSLTVAVDNLVAESGDMTVGRNAYVNGITNTKNIVVDGTIAAKRSLDVGAPTPDLHVASNLVVDNNLTVTGNFIPTGGFDLSSVDISSRSLSTTGNTTVGGTLVVRGGFDLSQVAVTAKSLTISGDSTLAAVNASSVSTSGDINIAGATNLTGNTTVKTGTFTVSTGASTVQALNTKNIVVDGTIAGKSTGVGTPDLHVASNMVIDHDLTVTGTFNPTGGLNLNGANIAAATLTTTGNTTVGGTLVVTGGFDLSQVAVTTKSLSTGAITCSTIVGSGKISSASYESTGNIKGATLNITGNGTIQSLISPEAEITTLNTANATIMTSLSTPTLNVDTISVKTAAGTIRVSDNTTFAKNVTVTGTFTPTGGIDLSGATINAAALTTTGNATIGGNLVVTGNFDLSNVALSTKSITTTGNGSIGGTFGVTGNTTLSNVAVTGGTSINTLAVSGAISSGSVSDINIADNTTFAKNITVTGTSTLTGAVSIKNDLSITGSLSTASLTVSDSISMKILNVVGVGAKIKLGDGTASVDHLLTVNGNALFNGDITCTGTINSAIDLTARDINPKNINASGFVTAAGDITSKQSVIAAAATIGAVGSTNNNMIVNGNVKATGNFEVGGVIIGALDQSTKDVSVKSLTTTTGNVVIGSTGKLMLSAGGIGSNTSITGTLDVSENVTFAKALNVTGTTTVSGALYVAAATTLGVTGTGALTASSLNVTGNTTLTGTLNSTGLVTVSDLTVTGTLTITASNLVTNTFKTGTYYVTPAPEETVSTATWTPSAVSNIFNVTLTANTSIAPIAGVNGGGSWFIYIKQDATGGRTVTWDSSYAIIGGEINTAPNAVSICQVVYCGYGSKYDVFIAQRP